MLLSRALSYATVLLVALVLLAWIPAPDPSFHRAHTVPLPTWAGASYVLLIVVSAIAVGLITRALSWAFNQVRYRAIDPRAIGDAGIVEVHVKPYVLEDADGETLFACRLDDCLLVHRSLDELVDDIVVAIEAMHDSGPFRNPTFSEYYADRVDSGIVDETRVRRSLRGELKADIKSTIARGGGNPPRVAALALDRKLERRYPQAAIQEILDELHRRGEVYRVGDEFAYHGGTT